MKDIVKTVIWFGLVATCLYEFRANNKLKERVSFLENKYTNVIPYFDLTNEVVYIIVERDGKPVTNEYCKWPREKGDGDFEFKVK